MTCKIKAIVSNPVQDKLIWPLLNFVRVSQREQFGSYGRKCLRWLTIDELRYIVSYYLRVCLNNTASRHHSSLVPRPLSAFYLQEKSERGPGI